jgi:hypothetical protein
MCVRGAPKPDAPRKASEDRPCAIAAMTARKLRRLRMTASGEKHVRLHRWLLRSAAWHSLSLAARCALIELYDLFNGENNGQIFLGAREAAKRLGTGKDRALNALHQLEQRGFIRARRRGDFQWKTGMATQWILTEFDFAGQPATKDFMRWGPAENQNPVPVARTDRPCSKDGSDADLAKAVQTVRIARTLSSELTSERSS